MNTKQDNIHLDALPRMANGIYKAARIVGSTMGAAGVNVSLQAKLNPKHLLINDGSTIVEAIELVDPIESIGLSFLKEAVARSNSNSGDGSSTTTILLAKILEEGIKSGVSTLEISFGDVKESWEIDEIKTRIKQRIEKNKLQNQISIQKSNTNVIVISAERTKDI